MFFERVVGGDGLKKWRQVKDLVAVGHFCRPANTAGNRWQWPTFKWRFQTKKAAPDGAAQDGYQPHDDFAKSIEAAYEVIKERVAQGGPGWKPKG